RSRSRRAHPPCFIPSAARSQLVWTWRWWCPRASPWSASCSPCAFCHAAMQCSTISACNLKRVASLPASADLRTLGLRERKKERTREMIRAHAMRLFRTQGYEGTTVQQIIDEVEISESTFFRYFPTKGDVVLTDDFDPIIVAAFQRQPAELSPIEALRRAFREAFGELSADAIAEQSDRMHMMLAVPELRAAMLEQFAAAMRLLSTIVSERAGRS